MQGQIPCSACWHCSVGFGGTRPTTPSEDLAERHSASASAWGWHHTNAAPWLRFPSEPAPRKSTRSAKEDVSQRWWSSSLSFLLLFAYHHKSLHAYCCCGCWIILKYVCMYVCMYVCVAYRALFISYRIVSPHLPMCSKGETKVYSNAFFLLSPIITEF